MTAPSPMSQGPYSPVPASPEPAPKSRRNLLIGGIAGGCGCLLLIALAIVLIIFLLPRGGGGGGEAGGGGTETTPVALTPEEQATALVTEYFDALVAGDGAAALEMLTPAESTDVVMLPAEAYTKALELAPVADVVVSAPVIEEGSPSGEVAVTFTVGGESFTDSYTVTDYERDDIWRIEPLFYAVSVSEGATALGMTLNGAEVKDGSRVFLLPGGYTVEYSSAHFAPESTDPVLSGVRSDVPTLPDPTLNEDGLTAFRGAVQGAVDACLAQKTLAAGCGMGEVPAESSDGWTMVEDTVSRSISEDTQRKIDTMVPTPSYNEPTYVNGTYIGSVTTTIECTKGGQRGTCEMWLGGGFGTPNVDMADPELPVTWS